MNKLVVISGCSGGGKSTLLSELGDQGYATIGEVGRQLVKEQLAANSGITPWEKPELFCELLIIKSIEAYHQAKKMKAAKDKVIFLDRSFLEGINYYQSVEIHKYDHFIDELRFYSTVFMAPPWKEIYVQDDARRHSFDDGVKEYNQLLKFYPQCGYHIVEIPKTSVKERVKFILSVAIMV